MELHVGVHGHFQVLFRCLSVQDHKCVLGIFAPGNEGVVEGKWGYGAWLEFVIKDEVVIGRWRGSMGIVIERESS